MKASVLRDWYTCKKALSAIKDLQRLSIHYDIPLRMPPDFPVRTVLAMRALSQAFLQRKFRKAAHILFNAYWSENLDIADPEVVAYTDWTGGS